jgi:hypothetical protein
MSPRIRQRRWQRRGLGISTSYDTDTNIHIVWDATGAVVRQESIRPVERAMFQMPTGQTNAGAVRAKLQQALTANATYLAGSPTQGQAVAHIAALTRQVNGVLRLLLGQLNDLSDT